jgi:xanthine dehydrogenase molybdenum-binding subunit
MSTKTLEFTLNGNLVNTQIEPDTTLLEVLREQFGLISPKNGCSPQGQCGCCTVIVDNRATVSCVVNAEKVAGKNVLTLEGVNERERDIFSKSFVIGGGLQCGFCIPGIVARAKSLIDKKPNPTREEITGALNPHICRCTGYVKIIDSIEMAAKALQGEPLPEQDFSGRIGTNLPRYHGCDAVLGDRPYIDDMKMPNMLYGALLFSPHPRAKVLSVDPSRALDIDGVMTVATAKDVPGQRFQGLIYPDWPLFVAEGEETRFVGDVIAAVAATTPKLARKALELIDVKYEVLDPVSSPEAALLPNAPKIHKKGNLLSTSLIKRGDADEALKNAPHVVTHTWSTQLIEHAFLEPESCIAVPGENETMHVYSQGQGVFDDRRQIASFLGVPEEKVTVTLVSNGGAFGGKEDLSIQGQTALLALMTNRPVKITISRDESICLHPKRHPIKMEYWVGCDNDGKLLAVKAKMIGDKGAYASVGSKVLERAAGHSCGPYRVDNVDVEALAVYTNNPPCGAMRGFGANQAAFALEGALDQLAEKIGIDGWEMRYRNAVDVGDTFATGQVFEHSVGLKKTLLAVKDAYQNAKYAGIACGIKNVGIGNGMPEYGRVLLVIEKDATVTIRQGFTEMGQGLYTVLIQCLCEETGIDPRKVKALVDTSKPLYCGMTTASRATSLGGNAVRIAAQKLKEDLKTHSLEELIGREYYGEHVVDFTTALNAKVEKTITHFSYGFATQVVILDEKGKLQKVVAAHDVGKVLNPKLLEGQLEGSIHMGLGYALSEELKVVDSKLPNTNIRSLGLLRAKDMPECELIFVEEHDPQGPFGAKGVGEIGLVPTAGAVAGALYKFDGVRRYSLPMKDAPAAKSIPKG